MTDASLDLSNSAIKPMTPTVWRWHSTNGYLWVLIALTGLSAFLSFNRLGVPPLLIDECFTYWRVCGNLDQLLDTLRNDAFMPLHYEILNWIHQGFPLGFGVRLVSQGIPLTPAVMRFYPAICGTLMTPVMYFLSRQMFSRATSLIAAAFITCSAYSQFFARNAKMYEPAWMFAMLSIACFLWWIRTWRTDAWLCWIFAGIAAGGFQAITLLLLPLTPLYFVSVGKFSRWKVPLLIIGLALILLAPAVYYGVCNRWTQNSGGIVPGVMGEPAADANWEASGLNWIGPTQNSIRIPLTAINAYLTGLEWDSFAELESPSALLSRFAPAMVALAAVTYGLFFLGALPWPHLRVQQQMTGPSLNHPQPWSRVLLWILLWLTLPAYGFFYCRSVDDFNTPVDLLTELLAWPGHSWPIALLGITLVSAGLNYYPGFAKYIAIPVLLLIVAAIVQAARYRWGWLDFIGYPVAGLGIAIVLPALLFHFCERNFHKRCWQTLRLVAALAVVFTLCEVCALMWNWLHGISMRKHPELPWRSIWQIRYVAIVMPAFWLAAAALIGRLPTRYLRIAAVVMICFYNLANSLARQYIQTNVPFDRAMADMVLAQPNSDTRTYFDLNRIADNVYFRPMVAYNACIAAGLKPTPAEFRNGYAWPYRWGTVLSQFKSACVYNPTFNSRQIHKDVTGNLQIKHVIVWELAGGFFAGFSTDAAVHGLGNGWVLTTDEKITTHWFWNWEEMPMFHRREFTRK